MLVECTRCSRERIRPSLIDARGVHARDELESDGTDVYDRRMAFRSGVVGAIVIGAGIIVGCAASSDSSPAPFASSEKNPPPITAGTDAGTRTDDAGACPAGETKCDGNDALTCLPSGIWQVTSCGTACAVVGGVSKCGFLRPSNLPNEICTIAQTAELTPTTATTTLTTDTCTQIVPQTSGLDICVMAYRKIAIPRGTVVRITSGTTKRAAALIGTDEVTIEGTIDVGGRGTQDGAGGGYAPAGVGTGGTNTGSIRAGGGGGGFGTAGQPGNDYQTAGPSGGALYGTAELIPLLAGSRGGGPVSGGAGGGLALVGCRNITLKATAVIDASGGGGQGNKKGPIPFGGGGGGSGGAILIETATLTMESGATVVANGGGGGSGTLADYDGTPGADGTRSTMPAAGGIAGYPTAGNGGLGGAASQPPTAGGVSGHSMSGGGGGGGAEGRIRVNARSGTALSGLTVSPVASLGVAHLE